MICLVTVLGSVRQTYNELALEPEGEPERQQSNGGSGVNNIVTDSSIATIILLKSGCWHLHGKDATVIIGYARSRAVLSVVLTYSHFQSHERVASRCGVRSPAITHRCVEDVDA